MQLASVTFCCGIKPLGKFERITDPDKIEAAMNEGEEYSVELPLMIGEPWPFLRK
jgi:hypothetical protein